MCIRKTEPYKGKSNFIGGKIEDGESGLDAAYREMFEEAGVERQDVNLKHLMDFTYHLSGVCLMVYVGRLKRDISVHGDENELYWSALDRDFFDEDIFAGDGNIGHILNTMNLNKKVLFEAHDMESEITLKKVDISHSERIHKMQIDGYAALLKKYGDLETNPGAETLEKVQWRFSFASVDHYMICRGDDEIGYIRINNTDGCRFRLSMMFILPEFQNRGYAQTAIKKAEEMYPQATFWFLDTIKQEPKLRHLYEKMGYRLTGEEKHIKDGMDLVDYSHT